ncbi:MAG: hypothetical protein E6G89_04160 [Alphaproteobacteria bacterium]|nr:MAG: hypothetical protein E6G89_04160 [Alphaproteobacteria bacterium]
MELGNIEAIKKMAGAGLGSSIIPRMAVSESDEGMAVRGPFAPPLLPDRHGAPPRQGTGSGFAGRRQSAERRCRELACRAFTCRNFTGISSRILRN